MVAAIKFIDRHAGNIICNFLAMFSKREAAGNSKTVGRILVIQLWGIGETILTLPAAIPIFVGLQAAASLATYPFLYRTRISNILPDSYISRNLPNLPTNFDTVPKCDSNNA